MISGVSLADIESGKLTKQDCEHLAEFHGITPPKHGASGQFQYWSAQKLAETYVWMDKHNRTGKPIPF